MSEINDSYSLKEKLQIELGALIGPLLIRMFGALCRYHVEGQEHIDRARESGKGVILALWHGRMLLPVYHYREQGISSLISLHRDGELIARVVRSLGYIPRRGSPKKGGREGFMDMLRDLRAGMTVAIFPDGPTGPRYSMHDGVLQLARMSGAPIVPLSFASKPNWQARSWDRFMVMKPFSSGLILINEPVVVPRKIDSPDEFERWREKIKRLLIDAEQETDRRMNVTGEEAQALS